MGVETAGESHVGSHHFWKGKVLYASFNLLKIAGRTQTEREIDEMLVSYNDNTVINQVQQPMIQGTSTNLRLVAGT